MRRKIVPVTPKTLLRSGLECSSCTRWEGLPAETDPGRAHEAKSDRMRRLIRECGACGKMIYVDNEALAYAQYGPARFFPGAQRFSTPVSDDAYLLTCLYVRSYARGRGLGRVLLQSVEASLIKRKVKAVEAFATRDEKHALGPIEFYLQNGFYIVRDDPQFPLMRLELKALVGWQINIQFALDGLKIPAHRRTGAPVSFIRESNKVSF
ncbi:MAG: GNAT family N-acetyltransferase [Candidatus Aquicultor sp.]